MKQVYVVLAISKSINAKTDNSYIQNLNKEMKRIEELGWTVGNVEYEGDEHG